MTQAKSFVGFSLGSGGAPKLGANAFIATETATGERRTCDNCQNRCITGPSISKADCINLEAKKAFNAGELTVMPKVLHSHQVGQFCKYFTLLSLTETEIPVSESINESTSEKEPMDASNTVADAPLFTLDQPLFKASATGRYFYPIDAVMPRGTNLTTLRYFNTSDEAKMAGLMPKD